jgi:hypothetical protein
LEAPQQSKKGVQFPEKLATKLFNETTEQSAIAYFDSKRVSMNDVSRFYFHGKFEEVDD